MDIHDFDEIRPFAEGEMKEAVEKLLSDRQFMTMIRGFVPLPKWLIRFVVRTAFIGIKTPLQFQKRFMAPVVKRVLKKCSRGCTFSGHPLPDKEGRYTYVSNHRDIVLDSAILDYKLFKHGYPQTVEIGIGDNLLIYPWIRILVKMNKAFTVRRGLTPRQLLESSQLMSRYIHYAVNEKKENIWIAQREGRAKDSDDRTQESVLKMLAMGGEGTSPLDKLRDLNIIPLTISYEYDPCDYLKAKEFQLKRDNPQYKKSRKDDLDNMKTGILGFKGRIHYECAPCINEWLPMLEGLPKTEIYKAVAEAMDCEIHRGYQLFPCNYIALDHLNGNRDNEKHYTQKDELRFAEYLRKQIAKIDIPNKDEKFLMERMLTMYANPARNKFQAENL